MLRYGTYIFGGGDSLYVVVDDGVSLVPQPDRTNAKCVFRVIGVDISLHFRKSSQGIYCHPQPSVQMRRGPLQQPTPQLACEVV